MEVIKGRMYDYNNGRFLSVDPFIGSPTSTQALNPYTYIFNNPLSGTDPSGYIAELTNSFGCNTTSGGGCAQDGNIFARADSVRNHADNKSANASLEKFATENNAYVKGRNRGRVLSGPIEEIEGQNLIAKNDNSYNENRDYGCTINPHAHRCKFSKFRKDKGEFQEDLKTAVEVGDA